MDEQKQQSTQQPIDATRRRLTQVGLAAPVVLATLASKNVLASAPYNCTVSGQLSGNMSSHGTPVSCSSLGVSPGCWKSPHVRGTAPAYSDTRWPSPYKPSTPFTTAFSSYPSGFNNKTMLEGLNTGGGGSIALARAAIGSLLNSLKFAPDYPLSPSQVQALFNATCNGGTITLSSVFPGITGTTAWDKDDVKNYFESLYGGNSDQCPAGKP
jgi:hypothetical protein